MCNVIIHWHCVFSSKFMYFIPVYFFSALGYERRNDVEPTDAYFRHSLSFSKSAFSN